MTTLTSLILQSSYTASGGEQLSCGLLNEIREEQSHREVLSSQATSSMVLTHTPVHTNTLCMHICHAQTHVHMHAHTYTCTYEHTRRHVDTHMYTMHTCTHTRAPMPAHTHTLCSSVLSPWSPHSPANSDPAHRGLAAFES